MSTIRAFWALEGDPRDLSNSIFNQGEEKNWHDQKDMYITLEIVDKKNSSNILMTFKYNLIV